MIFLQANWIVASDLALVAQRKHALLAGHCAHL